MCFVVGRGGGGVVQGCESGVFGGGGGGGCVSKDCQLMCFVGGSRD